MNKNTKFRALKLTLTVLGLFPFTTISHAQNKYEADELMTMSLDELMELEVFSAATRLPVEYSKAPGTVYKFNRDDFRRFGIRRVEELLQYVPGIQLNQYRKRHRSIWARGIIERYNDKMVLVVDGIQRRHLYYSHFSLGEEYPIENIENVEIIVGPASSLYGANAFAGLISITTRGFSNSAKAEIGAEIADNNRSKISASYSNDKVQAFASYLDHEAAFDDERKSFIGFDTEQPTDEYYGTFNIKAQPLKNLVLSLDYQKHKTPFLYIPSTQQAYIDTRSITAAVQYEYGNTDSGLYQFKGYYTQDRISEYEIEQQTRLDAYEENQDGIMTGVSLMASKILAEKHLFSIGASWEHDQADDFDFTRYWHFRDGFYDTPRSGSLLSNPDVNNNNQAVFFQDIWSINEQFDLTLGGRYDNYDSFGDHFNYRAALVYTPSATQVIKLLYGTATRTPTYREYLKVLDTDFVAPVPDPEEMKTIELSYHQNWDNIAFTSTLYRNQFDEYIQEVQTPDGEDEYFANSDDTWKMNGIEFLVKYAPLDKLNLHASLGYVHAKTSGTGKLPYVANWTGSFNADYNYYGRHFIGMSVVYNSDREDTNSKSEDDSDSFALVNLQLRGQINKQMQYTMGVNNLFDKKVYDPAADFGSRYNTERTEREVWARLTMKFDL